MGPSTFCAAFDADDAPLKIDLVPAEVEDVSAPKPCVHVQHDNRLQVPGSVPCFRQESGVLRLGIEEAYTLVVFVKELDLLGGIRGFSP